MLQVSKGEALTSLGGDDFLLHLLMLNNCMQIIHISLYTHLLSSIYTLTYSVKIKGRICYWGGSNFSQQSESITGCILCAWVMETFGHQNRNCKGKNSDKHLTPRSEKEKTIQIRGCCENVFCDENWNCKSLVFIESNTTKSLKSVMSPNWWVVWNLPRSRTHGSWDLSASSFLITDFCKRVFHY